MSEPRPEFDRNTWKDRPYWSQDYDNGRDPVNAQEAGTRNAETVRDALLGKPETAWNEGTFGDCECDYSQAEDDYANAVPELQDEAGVRYASTEEVHRYYDQLRPLDLKILRGQEDDH